MGREGKNRKTVEELKESADAEGLENWQTVDELEPVHGR
jgi:hypothetical protein